jgi:protein required for attachment to host cells
MTSNSDIKRTWIVVADGVRARIFVDWGAAGGEPRPVPVADLEGDRRPTREIGAERPGRTQESATTARHAYAPRVDWHQFAKHLFAKRVAALIEQAFERKAFDELILVAPPKALGELRAALHRDVHRHIRAEEHKDLTGLAEHELIQRVAALVAADPATR